MPLYYLVFAVYLVAADVCDRWALTRLSGVVPRYGKGLSRLVMGKSGRAGQRDTHGEGPQVLAKQCHCGACGRRKFD